MMMRVVVAIGLFFGSLPTVLAETVSIDGGAVTFEAPDGFAPISEELRALKYPSSRAPQYVIGNEGGGTTVAYDLKPHQIPQSQLGQVKDEFTKVFDRAIPGIEWVENRLIDLSGQDWIYFEMTSNAVDTDIYNIVLLTGYKDQMLAFNFNSTKEQFKRYESELRQSIETIRIN